MDTKTIIWISTVLIGFIPSLLFYVLRTISIYRKKNTTIGMPPLFYLILFIFLLIIGVVGISINPASYIVRVTSTSSLYVATLLGYFTNYWIVYARYKNVFRSAHTYITLVFCILTGVLDAARGVNTGSFIHNDSYTPSTIYYLYYLSICLAAIYLDFIVVRLFFISFYKSTDYSFLLRRIIGSIPYMLCFICAMLSTTNILIAALYGPIYQTQINSIIYVLIPFVGILSLIHVVPVSVISKVVAPFEKKRQKNEEYQKELLSFLHKQITACTFVIQRVTTQEFTLSNLVVEINDARDILWSHIPHNYNITVEKEANFITLLRKQRRILHSSGPYAFPKTSSSSKKHLLSLAQELHKLNREERLEELRT